MDIKIEVTINTNNTLMVSFDPKEDSWKFKKKNKLTLFNQIHLILNENFEYPLNGDLKDEDLTAEELVLFTEICGKYAGLRYFGSMHFKVEKLLREWIARGDLAL